MAFHIIENSTATIPYDMNDNFLHVAQSSITPKSGTELNETTSSINIGSSTYLWNKAYFSGIVYSNELSITSNKTLVHVASVELTAPAARIEITGLNGDADISYFIISSFIANTAVSTSYAGMYINGDSSTSNYKSVRFLGNTSTSHDYVFCGVNSVNPNIRNNYMNFRSKTGTMRKAMSKYSDVTFGEATTSIYTDTTSTVTSLVYVTSDGSNMETLTSIVIYKYGMD